MPAAPTARRRRQRARSFRSPVLRFIPPVLLAAFLLLFPLHRAGLSWYGSWLASLGLVTLLLYGFDKAQARRSGFRVPERLLHLLALLGGFCGAWAGMLLFRHKTRKPVFFVVLVASTLLHSLLLTLRPLS